MPYATITEVEKAQESGYMHERNTRIGDTFQKGDRHVWGVREGWQTADLIADHYCNHQIFPTLEDAIKRPLLVRGEIV